MTTGRNDYGAFKPDPVSPRWLVAKGMFNEIHECTRIVLTNELRGSLKALVERYRANGWTIDGAAKHGSVFANRDGRRQLLMRMHKGPVRG